MSEAESIICPVCGQELVKTVLQHEDATYSVAWFCGCVAHPDETVFNTADRVDANRVVLDPTIAERMGKLLPVETIQRILRRAEEGE